MSVGCCEIHGTKTTPPLALLIGMVTSKNVGIILLIVSRAPSQSFGDARFLQSMSDSPILRWEACCYGAVQNLSKKVHNFIRFEHRVNWLEVATFIRLFYWLLPPPVSDATGHHPLIAYLKHSLLYIYKPLRYIDAGLWMM